jgi:hypothetical protein
LRRAIFSCFLGWSGVPVSPVGRAQASRAHKRGPFLDDGQRAVLEHVRDTAAAALLDSTMLSDPEDEE